MLTDVACLRPTFATPMRSSGRSDGGRTRSRHVDQVDDRTTARCCRSVSGRGRVLVDSRPARAPDDQSHRACRAVRSRLCTEHFESRNGQSRAHQLAGGRRKPRRLGDRAATLGRFVRSRLPTTPPGEHQAGPRGDRRLLDARPARAGHPDSLRVAGKASVDRSTCAMVVQERGEVAAEVVVGHRFMRK
jgi:hypothetical protein